MATNVEQARVLLCIIPDDDADTLRSMEQFDKAGIVSGHRKLQKRFSAMSCEEQHVRAVLQRTLCMYDEFLKPASMASAAAQGLELTALSELRVGKWKKGKYLRGLLVVEPLKFVRLSISVLAEKESGLAARRLVLSDLFYTEPHVRKLLPRHAEVIIKEPCLVRDHCGGGTYIWLSNPACLEVVAHYPADILAQLGEDPGTLRDIGNRQHCNKNFVAAIELYTRSVKFAKEKDEKVLALSNRAESWLKLGYYANALADAEGSLTIDAGHLKSIARKVRALWGMLLYQTALEFLKDQVSKPEFSMALQGMYKTAMVFCEQSTLGNHDLSAFFLNGCMQESAPVLAEFIGPVKVGLSTTCQGRGLFLTSDVRQGDLLMVNNVFAEACSKIQSPPIASADDLCELKLSMLLQVIHNCLAFPRNLSKLYSMAEHDRASRCVLEKPAPSINLFKSNWDDSDHGEGQVLDVSRLRGIIGVIMDLEPRKHSDCNLRGAVCLLPAFMNHSCLPNVCIRRIGIAWVIFASKDLKAGSELFRTYGTAIGPASSRNVLGFVCSCPRCELEKRLGLEQRLPKWEPLQLFPNVRLRGFEQDWWKIAVELEKMMSLLAQFSKEQMQWLRTAYAPAYITALSLDIQDNALPCADDLVEAIHETAVGDLTALHLMFTLKQGPGAKRLNVRGQEIMHKFFTASFGHQARSLMDALMLHVAEGKIDNITMK